MYVDLHKFLNLEQEQEQPQAKKANKGLIIDWMDGRHLQFETYKEAKEEYEKMLSNSKINKEEIDLELLEVKKKFSNVK